MKIHILTLALLGAVLPAQTQNIILHDNPTPTVGNANAFPFGAAGTRIQQLIPGSVLGSTPGFIQDLFVNPQIATNTAYNVSQVHYGDFEIRMEVTQATSLSSTWASNSPNPTTVFRGPLVVRFERDRWVPLGMPASFLWLPLLPGDNLLVEFILWQVTDTGAVPPDANGYFLNVRSSQTGTIPRAYRRGWVSNPQTTAQGVDGNGIKLGFLFNDGNFVAHDGSCAGSSQQVPSISTSPGTWPQLGMPLDVHLDNGPVNLIAALALGLDTTSYGALPLPYDLNTFGAPGCILWHGPEAVMPFVSTNGSGAATFQLQFPNLPQFAGLRMYATWICFDPAANNLGLVPSGFATMIL